jgi:hypothetical protein
MLGECGIEILHVRRDRFSGFDRVYGSHSAFVWSFDET